MRITSQMMNDSYVNMYNSENYKKNVKSDDETEASDADEVRVGDDLVIEKSGDSIILSQIQEDDTRKIIEEIAVNSKRGNMLNQYITAESGTDDTSDALSQINYANRMMSLSNYL